MSDWEQRLRYYSANSPSRPRSSSPATLNGSLTSPPVRRYSTTTAPVAPPPAAAGGSSGGGVDGRGRSPSALDRLKANTAMNLVALELQRADALRQTRRQPSPQPHSGGGSHQHGAPLPPPPPLAEQPYRVSPTRSGSSAASYLPNNNNNSNGYLSGTNPVVRRASAATTAPVRASTAAAGQPNSMSPHAGATAFPGPTREALQSSATSMIDQFDPRMILHVLESKIQQLESRNASLEDLTEQLKLKNTSLLQELNEMEAREAVNAVSQSTLAGLQHEVQRLREELVEVSRREERRVEDVRLRFVAELDEERRLAASRDQEIAALRSAIRQLASIDRPDQF